MKRTTVARLSLFVLLAGGFATLVWQLLDSAPRTSRERPAAPVPLVDIIVSQPSSHAVTASSAGPVISAYEVEIRPEVGGRITGLHGEFEPGGFIPAGETIVTIDAADYELAVAAAEADVAKARATIALEQGRRVVAREELASLQGSLQIDETSRSLALRRPQLRQVQAELAAAQNRLQRATLDLSRTRVALPYDVVVLERERVSGEVVAARELLGRVTRADTYWVELRTQPGLVPRLRVRTADRPGSRVRIRHAESLIDGEVVRIRADVASGSRLAGVIAAIPVARDGAAPILLGSYVEAEIDAGRIDRAIRAPRRALRDNRRVWVVDAQDRLQVRDATLLWESAQSVLLGVDTLSAGDRVVVSRVSGLVPGSEVRTRTVDHDSGPPRVATAPAGDDG
ncbi:MAG: efflux RND transporter periplasmic adaptor subunit [Gammaproteobacteria bacterium]|nr:efflux RND transporter periplasmic adaptor subunit [Gammaproteobacteria bacterium]